MLSTEQITGFHEDGYVVLPDFKSADELAGLKARALEMASAHDWQSQKTIFTTDREKRKQANAANQYFLDSATTIKCFFEEKAFDGEGNLAQPIEQSINKIGHAMHDLDPVFSAFASGEKLDELAHDLGIKDPLIWQSMYIFKQPRIGGEVGWHQDGSFFYTKPASVLTFWFAVDDATLENGCLWVEPGGHESPLRERFTLIDGQTKMSGIDETPWPGSNKAIPLEVKAGTLVCFQGTLPHYSAENISDKPRHATTLHVTDGEADYAQENWIQRGPDFPVRGFISPESK
jgi:phytanoyl-CoA hydroxylase